MTSGGGGVEGEQHRERPPVRGEPAVVVEQVERDRGRAGLPDQRERLGVQRARWTRRRRRPAAGRPANVVAHWVCACPTSVAAWCGCRCEHGGEALGRAQPDRVHQARRRSRPAGGGGRRTPDGRPRRGARRARPGTRRRARRGRSAPPAARRPASRASGTGRPAGRGPGRAGRPPRGRAARGRTRRGRRGCRCRPAADRASGRGRRAPRRTPRRSRGRRRRRSPGAGRGPGRGPGGGRATRSARARASGGPPKCRSVRWATRVTTTQRSHRGPDAGHPDGPGLVVDRCRRA